jgi:RNA polymerase sigma-70 factor, ECF subfamily
LRPLVPKIYVILLDRQRTALWGAKRNTAKGSQRSEGKATHTDGPDLESVVQRAQAHDGGALEEIYRLYVRRVFGLCRYILESRESAEDVTSEVFLKLQRSIESYDGSIPFPKWLLRVAANQCIDALRRQKRGRQVIVEVEEGVAVIEPASPEPSPLCAVLSKEERAQVRDAIARLPENYRVPLVLRYYSELSYDEIAQQLSLQKNYVAALIFRAKQDLRRKLGHRSQ